MSTRAKGRTSTDSRSSHYSGNARFHTFGVLASLPQAQSHERHKNFNRQGAITTWRQARAAPSSPRAPGRCTFPATCAGRTPCRSSRAWRPTGRSRWTRSTASGGASRPVPAKPIPTRPGAKNGARWRTASRRSPTGRRRKAAPSRPATTTCAPAITTTARNASCRLDPRSSRCITTRCAATGARWNGCTRTSNASRCRTRTPACRPGS